MKFKFMNSVSIKQYVKEYGLKCFLLLIAIDYSKVIH